jgi:hypothetical protein
MSEPARRNPVDEVLEFWRGWMTAGVQAMQRLPKPPSPVDLEGIGRQLGELRGHLRALEASVEALESLVRAQQTMADAARRAAEEWRQGWEQMLRQGPALAQASHQSLEQLTRSMFEFTQKAFRLAP